jgi:hypothetical protein
MFKKIAGVALLLSSTTIVMSSLFTGCATESSTARMKDGVTYGVTQGVFRGRWWSYYERGSSYLAGQFLEEAEQDFLKALNGRSRDSWQARTYGLHFEEFFPNRELGIVYYHQGRYDEAEQQIQKSLQQIDTERGHHYLDLVKKEQIASGTVQDNTEPAIQTALEETNIIAVPELVVEVAANDDVGVEQVTVNGQELHQRGAAQEIALKEELFLEEGTHTIEVVAKDLAEKEVKQEVQVTVDLTGPTIGVFAPIEPTVTEDGTVILEGATVDKYGVTAITVGDSLVAESPGAPKLDFVTEMPLGTGENTFILAARDIAGNETRAAIKVFQGDPNSIQAKLWLLEQKAPEKLQLAINGALPLDLLLAATADEAKNEIRIKSPKQDQPYRHNKTLVISGEVLSTTTVASLAINGEPFDSIVGAPKESFKKRILIDQDALTDGNGTMLVKLEATDEAGETFNSTLQVNLNPVTLNRPDSRMPLAVLAFNGAGVDQGTSEALRSTTEGALINLQRFDILERQRLSAILTEQELSAALSDPNEALNLGKVTTAHAFLTATVIPREGTGIEIQCNVIDTETSSIIQRLDAYITDMNSPEDRNAAANSIAAQLMETFPRLSGELRAVAGGGSTLVFNWTSDDNVRPGAYVLIVFEDVVTDDDTGDIIYSEFMEIGRAKIANVNSSGSRGTIENPAEGITLEKGMPAITM